MRNNKQRWLYAILSALVSTVVFTGPAVAALGNLLTPVDGAVIPQNDPSTGCAPNATFGFGFKLTFTWEKYKPTNKVAYYTVEVWHGATRNFPIIFEDVLAPNTSYTDTFCNSFVIDDNLADWHWEITAFDANGNFLDDSGKGPASKKVFRTFNFAPCRLADGSACYAPAP